MYDNLSNVCTISGVTSIRSSDLSQDKIDWGRLNSLSLLSLLQDSMHEPSGALHSLEKQWEEDGECVNMNENRLGQSTVVL